MSDAWIFAADDERAVETARTLAELGFRPVRMSMNGSVGPSGGDGATPEPAVAIIVAEAGGPSPIGVFERMRGDQELGDVPVVVAVESGEVAHDGLVEVDELIVHPFCAAELRARITRARRQISGVDSDEAVRFGSLEIDLATYVVSVDGTPIDFAYMEYELLKFLATHPDRVFSREALLSRVWGYDYFGGARTVDVHVRRVRAKLGQEHAARLKTVRGVGYRWKA